MLKFDTATLPAQIISAAVISSLNVLIPNCGELENNVVLGVSYNQFDWLDDKADLEFFLCVCVSTVTDHFCHIKIPFYR